MNTLAKRIIFWLCEGTSHNDGLQSVWFGFFKVKQRNNFLQWQSIWVL